MRAALGIAVDAGEVSAVLVDADTPLLGPFDSQRWPATEAGDAAGVEHAVAAMVERAAGARLTIDTVGVVTAGEDDEILAAVDAVSPVPAVRVPLDTARLAFLAAARELAGSNPLALHTRTGEVESLSIVDTATGSVLSSVVRDDDPVTGHGASLPEIADEAIARAGAAPAGVVFLDLRPGDAAPARELSAVLGAPFVTPHGVPWHRATGAALMSAREEPTVAAASPPVARPGSRRGVVLTVAVVGLAALLSGGLAAAMGGVGGTRDAESVEHSTTVIDDAPETPSPTTGRAPSPVPDSGDEPAPLPSEPCDQVRPVSWPGLASDPAPGPDHGAEPSPLPCDPPPAAP